MKLEEKYKRACKRIEVRGEQLLLVPERAIFWEKTSFLIITDLHLGKAGHFRKAGIPIPTKVHQADLLNLQFLIDTYHPQNILILGDLFHSEINTEWNQFRVFLNQNEQLNFILVKGNHDILPADAYQESNLKVYEKAWEYPPFYFTHHPPDHMSTNQLYAMSGHIHPGYRVKVKADQYIKLPCFFFSDNGAILPAFGKFTGCIHMPMHKSDQVFVVLSERNKSGKVIQVYS